MITCLYGFLSRPDPVDPGHPELVLDALLQAGDLLVLNVRIGDLDGLKRRKKKTSLSEFYQ